MKIEITDTSIRVLEQQWLYDAEGNPVQAKNHSASKGRGDYVTDEEFVAAREELVGARLGMSLTQAVAKSEISQAKLKSLQDSLASQVKLASDKDKEAKGKDTVISNQVVQLAAKDAEIAELQAQVAALTAQVEVLTVEEPAPTP